jgi:hypothetical protein
MSICAAECTGAGRTPTTREWYPYAGGAGGRRDDGEERPVDDRVLEPLGFEEDLVDLAPPPEDGVEHDAGQFWTDFITQTAPEFRKPTIEQLSPRSSSPSGRR